MVTFRRTHHELIGLGCLRRGGRWPAVNVLGSPPFATMMLAPPLPMTIAATDQGNRSRLKNRLNRDGRLLWEFPEKLSILGRCRRR